jgi:hypothetical protein
MRGKLWAILVAVVGVMLLSIEASSAPAAVGEVLALAGQCSVEAGGTHGLLAVGDPVHVGDTLDVPAGAKLKLRMEDGSVLSLASGSRITIQAYDVDNAAQHRDAKLSLAAGLLRAVVATLSQPSHFEVDTATGVAAVGGTDWFVLAEPGSTQVGVLTGSVSLSSVATEKTITIPARWGARVEAGMDPVPARVWTPAEFNAVIERTNLN